MAILAIESSCDETAAAVISDAGEILSNTIYSQIKTHAEYGGVVPEIASREHLSRIEGVVDASLDEAMVTLDDINAVAATRGPGLVGALLVGLQYAKGIAFAKKLPFYGIDHLEGHIMSTMMPQTHHSESRPSEYSGNRDQAQNKKELTSLFPFLCLIVSGGHSAIYKVDGVLDVTLLGDTRDDAAGEAFDKSGKLLGLDYPAGAAIDRLAQMGDAFAYDFPVAFKRSKDIDFSFSGLKTAVRYTVRDLQQATETGTLTSTLDVQTVQNICASLQRAICDQLIMQVNRAVLHTGIRTVTIGGGVAANSELRERLSTNGLEHGYAVKLPPRRLCTDNAGMIGLAAWYRRAAGVPEDPFTIRADPRARVYKNV